MVAEIEKALQELQPHLRISAVEKSEIVIEGDFILSGPEGDFDQYAICSRIPTRFPMLEPLVFETGGRIPRNPDRHINKNGSCCLTVWEEWLAIAPDHSFRAFLGGPLKEFFLNQWWFEKQGKWRFGERSHGAKGLVEAYASVLGISPRTSDVLYFLRLLRQPWPKGHWACPCSSGIKLRQCHRQTISDLHQRLTPELAERMFWRLLAALPESDRRLRPHYVAG